MPGGRKRTPEQREADFVDLSRMYLTRHTQDQMAQRFGVTRQQISLDLKELHRRWAEKHDHDINERKVIELDRIDSLETEAWEAYRRTVGEKRRKTVKTSASSDGDTVIDENGAHDAEAPETTETTWEDAGDDRFLGRVAWCIQKRCDILGLDAPKKSEITGREMPTEDVMRAEVMKAFNTPGTNGHAKNRN